MLGVGVSGTVGVLVCQSWCETPTKTEREGRNQKRLIYFLKLKRINKNGKVYK